MKNSPNLRVQECNPAEYADALRQLTAALKQPVPFLQSPFYGTGQEHDGKTVVYFAAYSGESVAAAGLAVKFDAPGGISFFYCPYGPVVRRWTPELASELRKFFVPFARHYEATFVRFDSEGLAGALPGLFAVPNRLAVTASLQPRAEWLLDISGDEEKIWMGMHKHARYNVRLAERADAHIDFYEPAKAPVDTFLELMRTTAGRDSFSLQNQGYYQSVLATLPPEHGFMAVVTIGGKPAAAAIFAEYDGMVHYVFAGSSNDFRKIAPPYFLIWQTILEARRRGWNTLNFGGIADDVKGTHLAGVTGFKKRFGGYQVDHPNPVDLLVYKTGRYLLFKLYKSLK